MKTIILLSFLMVSTSLTGLCKTWSITNSGFTFNPASITIALGDSVKFILASAHNGTEVSEATWSANGTTALAGGFQTEFGGGVVLPAELEVGTHYYVCTAHASSGMKGTIIVQNATGFVENQSHTNLSIYPNPSDGKFELLIDGSLFAGDCNLEIYNVLGDKIYHSVISSSKSDIDLKHPKNGIYFLKIYDGQTVRTKKIVIHY